MRPTFIPSLLSFPDVLFQYLYAGLVSRLLPVPFLIIVLLCSRLHADPAQILNAERSQTFQDQEEIVRNMAGVVYQDLAAGVRIQADSARAWIREDRYWFVSGASPVVFEDSSRSIRADTLTYDFGSRVATFSGAVRLQDALRTLSAPRVSYGLSDHVLTVTGPLFWQFLNEGLGVGAGSLVYHTAQDSGVASRGVAFSRFPEADEDTLLVSSQSLVFTRQGRQLHFAEDVSLRQGGWHVGADRADYDREAGRVRFEGEPEVSSIQVEESGRDSIRMGAGEIEGGIEGGRIRKLDLNGRVDLRIRHLEDGNVEDRTIRADTLAIGVLGQRFESLRATGKVRVEMRSEGKLRTKLGGHDLSMAFEGREMDSLFLSGSSQGRYVSETDGTVSLTSGHTHRLWFEAGRLRRAVIEDRAVCLREPEDGAGSGVSVSGDRVWLEFEEGELREVTAAGGVKGTYHPPSESDSQ